MHSKCNTDHAWGPVMTISRQNQCRHGQVLVLPKGIDLSNFTTRIPQILRKSMRLSPFLITEYRHAIILKSFNLLQKELTSLLLSLETEQSFTSLKELTIKLNIERKVFSREEFKYGIT
jgi:hypothetical protein